MHAFRHYFVAESLPIGIPFKPSWPTAVAEHAALQHLQPPWPAVAHSFEVHCGTAWVCTALHTCICHRDRHLWCMAGQGYQDTGNRQEASQGARTPGEAASQRSLSQLGEAPTSGQGGSTGQGNAAKRQRAGMQASAGKGTKPASSSRARGQLGIAKFLTGSPSRSP